VGDPASGADQPSLRRLTRAAATVISDITSGRADLTDTVSFVGFDSVFERIRRQVRQLTWTKIGTRRGCRQSPKIPALDRIEVVL
jgi:hypothetical protein